MGEEEAIRHLKAMRRLVRAIWVLNWFNSCGFTELLPVVASRFDMERFGLIPVSSPRHADALIVAGYQTMKSIKRVRRIWEQMAEPKALMALGSCTMGGGMYWDSYNTIKRLTDYVPVHVFVPGCPPRPEQVFDGVIKLVMFVHQKWEEMRRAGKV